MRHPCRAALCVLVVCFQEWVPGVLLTCCYNASMYSDAVMYRGLGMAKLALALDVARAHPALPRPTKAPARMQVRCGGAHAGVPARA